MRQLREKVVNDIRTFSWHLSISVKHRHHESRAALGHLNNIWPSQRFYDIQSQFYEGMEAHVTPDPSVALLHVTNVWLLECFHIRGLPRVLGITCMPRSEVLARQRSLNISYAGLGMLLGFLKIICHNKSSKVGSISAIILQWVRQIGTKTN